MIVPVLNFPTDPTEQNSFSDSIKRAALLGRAAVRMDSAADAEALEKTLVAASGFCEIQIFPAADSGSFSDDFAFSMLNAGASHILVERLPDQSTIPPDRIQLLENGVNSSKDCDPERVADEWKAGNDWHVDGSDETALGDLIANTLFQLLSSDRPDGLWPTVIVDRLGVTLGLAYSNEESLRTAINQRVGCYWSRSRNELWIKGATSGATQSLVDIRLDCDYDAIRFKVDQGAPGFCHKETHSCFGYERSFPEVIARLTERIDGADAASFTRKLFNDPEMLRKKLLEEAGELSEAETSDDAAWEAADVLYFSMIAMMRNGAQMHEVFAELARRMNRVQRRKNKLEQ